MNIFQSENQDVIGEGKYLRDLVKCFKIAYNLSTTQNSVLTRAIYELIRKIDPLNNNYCTQHQTEIYNLVQQFKNEFSRDSISNTYTLLKNLTYDDNLKNFAPCKFPTLFKDILVENRTTVIDISNIDTEEQILFQMVFLTKMTHLIKELKAKQIKFNPKIMIMEEPAELSKGYPNPRYDLFLDFVNILRPLMDESFGLILQCLNVGRLGTELSILTSNFIGLRTTNVQGKRTLWEFLQLNDSPEDSASFRRKNKYQRDYITKLPAHLAIFKPDNIEFPFAIQLDYQALKTMKRPKDSVLVESLKRNGYDMQAFHLDLEEKSTLTAFEKDFEEYITFLPEIMQFLADSYEIDRSAPSGLTFKRYKDTFKEYVDGRLRDVYEKSSVVRKTRDELLNIIIEHNYLSVTYKQNFPGSTHAIKLYKPTEKIKESIYEYKKKYGADELEINFDEEDKRNHDENTEYIETDNTELDNINETSQVEYQIPNIENQHMEYNNKKKPIQNVPENFNLEDIKVDDGFFDAKDDESLEFMLNRYLPSIEKNKQKIKRK
ncbi:MAG: hypothetical protein GF364_16335 [Candidatus Lokiarchaeota archaeon]|nr:hypothetical protein [Candidatus Lokiarchaeota archaeon]